MPRLRLVALVAAVVVAAVTLPASLTRVPPGKVALSAGRVHPAGWMLHIPGRTPPIVPSEGRIRADGIELLTKEGSRLAFRLELDYRIGTTLAPQLLRDVRSGTLDGAVTSLARRVVDEAVRRESAESLVESPERLEAPIAAALTSAGIAPSNLSFRSPVAEDLARRRGTEAVRALARPPARVLVIGWDGADWDSIRPLVAAGRMPNMARFLREGAHGDRRHREGADRARHRRLPGEGRGHRPAAADHLGLPKGESPLEHLRGLRAALGLGRLVGELSRRDDRRRAGLRPAVLARDQERARCGRAQARRGDPGRLPASARRTSRSVAGDPTGGGRTLLLVLGGRVERGAGGGRSSEAQGPRRQDTRRPGGLPRA